MAFNPLQNYLGGQQAGQQQQANTLAGRLAGQAQNPEFRMGQSTDFRNLMAIDPDRANKTMETFQNLSESRKKAYFDDMVTGKAMLDAGDLSGFGKFQENRLENLKRLGSDDITGTEMVIDKFNQGDIAGLQQGYAAGIDAGRQLGYIKPDARQGAKKAPFQRGEGGLVFDPNTGSYSIDPTAERVSKKTTSFSPDISPVQTDPETGQKYIIKTDRNSGASTRVDVENAIGESQGGEEQRLIRRELIKDAGEESKNAFKSLKVIKQSLGTMDEVIAALDKGASTGVIDRFLPSFTEATLELENAANRMGLDVVSATTFGALSEGELRLAMNTALPTNMEPKALREWVVGRKKAKQKLARELNKMAISLGKGKVTIAEYLEKNATFGKPVEEMTNEDLFN